MVSKLMQLAKRDSRHIVTKGGFEVEITLSTRQDDLTISLTGFATKHWNSFDSDGLPINAKNVHICVSETDLNELNFPCRTSKGEINLLKCKVSFVDSSGISKKYVVEENMPDETLGLIVLILKDYLD